MEQDQYICHFCKCKPITDFLGGSTAVVMLDVWVTNVARHCMCECRNVQIDYLEALLQSAILAD